VIAGPPWRSGWPRRMPGSLRDIDGLLVSPGSTGGQITGQRANTIRRG
jgi:hypothetical protein